MANKFYTAIKARFFNTAADTAVDVGVTGDTHARVAIDAGGKLTWGTGASAGDTTMYRSGVQSLKTDGTFVTGYLTVSEQDVITTGASTGQALLYDSVNTQFAPGDPRPIGGLEGQILAKLSDTNYDTTWIDNYANEVRYTVKNDTGSTISKFTVVAAVGAVGDTIRAAPFVNDGSVAAEYILGVASENIATGATGYVTAFGPLKGLNTDAWPLGTVLYSSASTAGLLTNTKPASPDISLPIAFVTTQSTNNGRIFVRAWSQGQTISELYDVTTSSPTSGDVLSWNGAVWSNRADRVPTGGTNGQVLTKQSSTNWDLDWEDPPLFGNLDGGAPDSNYVGITAIDAGGV